MDEQLIYVGAYLGCDPEVFVSDEKGNVIPSFAFIPKEGIVARTGYKPKVMRDGVQVELQPDPTYCREEQRGWMGRLIQALQEKLPPGAKIDFTSNIVIPEQKFRELDPEGRRLGCSPSLNVYGPSAITVNPDTYRRRSAGGHIHLGSLSSTIKEVLPGGEKVPTEFAIKLVKTLDAVLGNTCVLIDRDPLARTRRRVYGRAGEYRLPSSGRLEYRTLSNFWMRAPYLQSFVYAVARQAVDIVTQSQSGKVCNSWDAYEKLFAKLDEAKVRRAINQNNYDLAFENWLVVREFFDTHCRSQAMGLDRCFLPAFDKYLAHIKEYGLESVVPADPVRAWVSWQAESDYYLRGWEYFIGHFEPKYYLPKSVTVSSSVN